MRMFEVLMESPAISWIGWSLLHSLWQSAAVALVLGLVLKRMRRSSAEARYLAACGALMLMVVLPAATPSLVAPIEKPGGPPETIGSVRPALAIGTLAVPAKVIEIRSTHLPAWLTLSVLLPALVAVWMFGVVALSLRLLGGWLVVRRLGRSHARPASDQVHQAFAALARAFRVHRGVRLLESSLVKVPIVLGGFRPVLLLPVSALTGLTSGQLEALLAHELAHIRRHDYLVNLAQSALEVVLFYHPAAWWVSQVIRTEREHCCDDLAVRVCGDRLAYARALAAMEGLRSTPRLSLAASDGPLLARVRRILGREAGSLNRMPAVGLLAALLIGLSLLTANAQPAGEPASEPRPAEPLAPLLGPFEGTIYVPLFRSLSSRRDLQLQLTELVIKEIERRTPCKVVSKIEDAEVILEGTVNLTEQGTVIRDPFNPPRKLDLGIKTTVHLVHNPPLDGEEDSPLVTLREALNLDPEDELEGPGAFFPSSRALASRIVDAIKRSSRRGADVESPPTEEEVWKKLVRLEGGMQRLNVRFKIEKIGEKVGPVENDPEIGPCRTVHGHYKCTVTFDEWRRPDGPLPVVGRVVHHVEVVYLDKRHLRRIAGSPTAR